MRPNVIFGHPKWPPAAILLKQIAKKKNKLWYWYEMVRNAIQSDFWTSKMAISGDFLKIARVIWTMLKPTCWPTTTWYHFWWIYIYIYIQTAMLGTREYTLCSPFRANAHNSSYIYYSVTFVSSVMVSWINTQTPLKCQAWLFRLDNDT